jgi:hypothetical protein
MTVSVEAFYGTLTQFSLYDAETEEIIVAYLGCYKLKATPGFKTTSLARV